MNYSALIPLTDWERGSWVLVSKCARIKRVSHIFKMLFAFWDNFLVVMLAAGVQCRSIALALFFLNNLVLIIISAECYI